ncbi:hypothetical protein [Streptomyces sp. NPDC057675]|uniref:hypothetical protein n=1 Tax=Streptomyces sp. NPDC057675 TaxID=3346204 RepID=UPI0036CA41A5
MVGERAGVNFGMQQWPHTDDVPVTRHITYRNLGTTPVTLDLAVETTGQGDTVPPGMFTASPRRLTVPAGGTAEADVTADTRLGTTDGTKTGVLLAAGDGQQIRTALAVQREAESYTLTVRYRDHQGVPTTPSSSVVA